MSQKTRRDETPADPRLRSGETPLDYCELAGLLDFMRLKLLRLLPDSDRETYCRECGESTMNIAGWRCTIHKADAWVALLRRAAASSLTGPQTPREPFRSDRDATCDWNCTKPYPHDGPCGAAEVVVNPLHEAGQQARASLPTLMAAAGVTGATRCELCDGTGKDADCERAEDGRLCGWVGPCSGCKGTGRVAADPAPSLNGERRSVVSQAMAALESDATLEQRRDAYNALCDMFFPNPAADPAPPVSGPLDNRPMTQDNELRILRHEHALIEAQTQRGITDCSTPLHIRVQNIVEQLEKAEAQLAALVEQQRRYENAQCITCAQDLDAHSSAALPDAPIRQLIETWREKAKRMEADAEDAQRDANVSIVHPYAWEASRLNDCANELEALLTGDKP